MASGPRPALLARRVPAYGEAAEHGPRTDATTHLIWLVLLASIVPWRREVYFDGEFDPVVVGKAVMAVLALALAAGRGARSFGWNRLGAVSIGFVILFVGVSLVGGLAADNTLAAAVSGLRLLMVAATVALVVRHDRAEVALRALLNSMAIVGVVAAASGVPSVLAGGRLAGTMPPLNPNDIALLCAVPAIGIFHERIIGSRRWRSGLLPLGVLVGLVWLTGSRTGLFALFVAFALVVLHARRLGTSSAIGLIALAPLAFAVVTLTPLAVQAFERGDSSGQNILTLSARTIAWRAVLAPAGDSLTRWFGSGMSVRQVDVAGQFWDKQVLDSSWISALAQAGIAGVAIMAIFVVTVMVWSVRSPRLRTFATPVIAFLLIRSVLENGLIDTNVMFIVFFTLAALLEAKRAELPNLRGS